MLLLASALTGRIARADASGASASATQATADAPSRAPVARYELWLAVSATLLSAGLAGTYALKVAALHDRADTLPINSPERPALERDAADARRYAYGLGAVASLLTLTSALLLIYQPSSDAAPAISKPGPAEPSRRVGAQVTPTIGARHVGILCAGRF